MTVKFDKLAESLGLDPQTREQITEAWETKLREARQEITAELREEFAEKFEHDKVKLVKSMDRFLSEKVQAEIAEFAQDKQALAEERVKNKAQFSEACERLEDFVTRKLAAEVRELREDRTRQVGSMENLEKFVLRQLSEEVRELHEEKQQLVEHRVKLVSEQKRKLNETRTEFVRRAAETIEENINKVIAREIAQYREDIDRARSNDFGRRIFEAFVGEYMTSHLNESSQINKMHTQMKQALEKLQQAQEQIVQEQKQTHSVQLKLKAAQDLVKRERMLSEMMSPLSKQQRNIMEELLENVKTAQLAESFDRYLPAVLNENNTNTHKTRQSLKEGVRSERSGDRRATLVQQQADSELELEMNQLRKLAGIGQ